MTPAQASKMPSGGGVWMKILENKEAGRAALIIDKGEFTDDEVYAFFAEGSASFAIEGPPKATVEIGGRTSS